MANVKISAMPTATTPLTGNELINVVQGGVSSQTTARAVAMVNNYAQLYDAGTAQTASADTATLVLFGSTTVASGITNTGSGVITFPTAGTYLISYRLDFANSSATTDYTVSTWLRLSGVDIANSGTDVTVPFKATPNGYAALSANFVVTVTAGQTISVVWSTPNVAITIEPVGTRTTPTRPVRPSAVFTATQIA